METHRPDETLLRLSALGQRGLLRRVVSGPIPAAADRGAERARQEVVCIARAGRLIALGTEGHFRTKVQIFRKTCGALAENV